METGLHSQLLSADARGREGTPGPVGVRVATCQFTVRRRIATPTELTVVVLVFVCPSLWQSGDQTEAAEFRRAVSQLHEQIYNDQIKSRLLG